MYKCIHCGKEVDFDLRSSKRIICPFCGYRVLTKVRAKTVKTVPAF